MLPFPPALLHPPGLRRRKSEEQKKGGGSIKHFHTSHCCLLCSTVCSVHKGKLSVENFKHWLH